MQLKVKLEKTAEMTYLQANKQKRNYRVSFQRFWRKKKHD